MRLECRMIGLRLGIFTETAMDGSLRFQTGSCLSLAILCCALTASAYCRPLSSYDGQVDKLLQQMTLEEKIGQMTQAELDHIRDLNDIWRFQLGSVLCGGDSDPKAGNGLEAWTQAYEDCQAQTLKTRLQIPLLFGVDAVHGHNNVLGAVIFPHHIGLGCTRDPGLVELIYRVTAQEIRATGINWSFSPCVTVPQDIRWGRTYEGFSEDPALVELLGQAAIRGLQGQDLGGPLSVLACAKHYLADGGTKAVVTIGRDGRQVARLDQGDAQMDEATLRRIHLRPYIGAVKAGVGSIMPSYSSWNGIKCSGHRYLLTDILKKELGFEGFLISDYNAINQIDPDYKAAIAKSINAGMDMAMVPNQYRQFFTLLRQLVLEGQVPMERIDDAVRRILRVKFAMGLMDKDRSLMADRTLWQSFGGQAHRQLARQAVRQSVVLLKNDGHCLPISKRARIHVAGRGADNLGMQCGGWTITWQGRPGNLVPGGTSILCAIRNTVDRSARVTYSADGSGAEGAQVGVVVVGEQPYAEGLGDNADLSLDQQDIETVKNVKAAGIPVVVVLLSGRPLIINEILEMADAFLAAWLPGTEGQGVADVLFGDYNPTGKLSFTWPASMDQVQGRSGKPLFEYGFGLTY
ncbi:MAG: glycoside hydrolase family 3 N-terminal domain-containing protein [Sedimentisphaerales bacterium]|nr:glycoside hydrolase family 3 N-terminal domain-containing protein [Sedimentisphaerales bacterium]